MSTLTTSTTSKSKFFVAKTSKSLCEKNLPRDSTVSQRVKYVRVIKDERLEKEGKKTYFSIFTMIVNLINNLVVRLILALDKQDR